MLWMLHRSHHTDVHVVKSCTPLVGRSVECVNRLKRKITKQWELTISQLHRKGYLETRLSDYMYSENTRVWEWMVQLYKNSGVATDLAKGR